MPNFREWTASEIIATMPQARNVLAKHFGPEAIGTGSGFQIRELAKRRGVDIESLTRDLKAMAKGNPYFS